jgi:hypothetical protein
MTQRKQKMKRTILGLPQPSLQPFFFSDAWCRRIGSAATELSRRGKLKEDDPNHLHEKVFCVEGTISSNVVYLWIKIRQTFKTILLTSFRK